MPHAALANDLMIFYAPRELYDREVTVLEMICASTCVTSMICFTLEAKYRAHLKHRPHIVAEGDTPEARLQHVLSQWPW